MTKTLPWNWGHWSALIEPDRFAVQTYQGEKLLSWGDGFPLVPVTGQGKTTATEIRLEAAAEDVVHLKAMLGADIGELTVELVRRSDHLECRAWFTAQADGALHDWAIFPAGTQLDLYQALHIRNRHFTPRVVERYNLGGHLNGGELGNGGKNGKINLRTDSRDWQFAPNPSYFVFEKGDISLFFGAKDLPQGFGLDLDVESRKVRHWLHRYGGGTFHFREGERIESPVYCLFVTEDQDYWDVVDRWVRILITEQRILDPSKRTFTDAMLKPYLGPWIDQCYMAGRGLEGNKVIWNWGDEDMSFGRRVQSVCSERFIRAVVEKADQADLSFGSIGIDDRWFDWRGDYELVKDRFPDMRGLIDWLHDKGLKVLLWLPPFDVEPQARMNQKREWLAGGGSLTRHGQAFLDYSHPEVQEQWLLPKLRLWLSDEPGCWNADGFKLDFMADKIPESIPLYDRSWQGEEMFLWRWHKLVYETMKAIKPESILLGCAAHPYFAQYQDWVRTYDVFDSDHRQHGSRGLRIRHLTPGTLLSYDFHCHRERLTGYLDQALQDHAHIEIGSVFGSNDGELQEHELSAVRASLEKSQPKPGLTFSPHLESKLRRWSFY